MQIWRLSPLTNNSTSIRILSPSPNIWRTALDNSINFSSIFIIKEFPKSGCRRYEIYRVIVGGLQEHFNIQTGKIDEPKLIKPFIIPIMLKAFLDRGARSDADGLMCVSACIYKPELYAKFVADWENMLSAISTPPPPYFHATDFFTRGGIFRNIAPNQRDAIAKSIPQIINTGLTQSVTIAFREKEFEKYATPDLVKRFGNLNGLAFQMCLGRIGHWANKNQYYGPIQYTIEAGDEDQADINGAFNEMNSVQKIKKHTRLSAWEFIRKGKARGLEAADYCAWHWNKYDAETLTVKRRQMRKDYVSLIFPDSDKHEVFRYTGKSMEEFLHKAMAQARLLRKSEQ